MKTRDQYLERKQIENSNQRILINLSHKYGIGAETFILADKCTPHNNDHYSILSNEVINNPVGSKKLSKMKKILSFFNDLITPSSSDHKNPTGYFFGGYFGTDTFSQINYGSIDPEIFYMEKDFETLTNTPDFISGIKDYSSKNDFKKGQDSGNKSINLNNGKGEGG